MIYVKKWILWSYRKIRTCKLGDFNANLGCQILQSAATPSFGPHHHDQCTLQIPWVQTRDHTFVGKISTTRVITYHTLHTTCRGHKWQIRRVSSNRSFSNDCLFIKRTHSYHLRGRIFTLEKWTYLNWLSILTFHPPNRQFKFSKCSSKHVFIPGKPDDDKHFGWLRWHVQ